MLKKENKFAVKVITLSSVGIVTKLLWEKKSVLEAIVRLHQHPLSWVLIKKEPEVFLTKAQEASKKNLFAYLDKSSWRLVDQISDKYFWMNSQEEIILLTRKKVWGAYCTWTASRPFFSYSEYSKINNKEENTNDEYDMTEQLAFANHPFVWGHATTKTS